MAHDALHTDGSEHWESLKVLEELLRRSLDLHHNGSVPVKMSETSLYNLLAAARGDLLEIRVAKVAAESSVHFENPRTTIDSMKEEWLTATMMSTNGSQFQSSTMCGNCGRWGHTIRDCVGPVDEDGELDGCPKCNTARSHMYDDCPDRDSDEDFDYIYKYRQRKPPIRSCMAWTSFLGESAVHQAWPTFIPWSKTFSLEQHEAALGACRPPEWLYYEYDQIGWPDLEARSRLVDPDSEFMVL
jgi:hypothetical protein